MRTLIATLAFLILSSNLLWSQTTAQNWTKADCDGQMHTLFDELDSGYVIILEFAMMCGPCSTAAHAINSIYYDYQISHPGKVRSYLMDYSNTFTCQSMSSWVGAVNCKMFLDGTHEVGYYGPFGMPTIVVLGGMSHTVFYNGHGFNPPADIQYIRDAIDLAITATGVNEMEDSKTLNAFPNPSDGNFTIDYFLKSSSDVTIALYDFKGALIRSDLLPAASAGKNNYFFETGLLSEGIYTVLLSTNESTFKVKVVISR